MEILLVRALTKFKANQVWKQLQLHLLLRLKFSLIQFMDLLVHQQYHWRISTQKLNSKNNKEEKCQENRLQKLKLFWILNNLLEQQNKLSATNYQVPMIQKKYQNKNLKRIMAQFTTLLRMMKKTKIQQKQENQSNMLKNN